MDRMALVTTRRGGRRLRDQTITEVVPAIVELSKLLSQEEAEALLAYLQPRKAQPRRSDRQRRLLDRIHAETNLDDEERRALALAAVVDSFEL